VVPREGETVTDRQDGKREHFKPVLPTRFKAAIWVSPKGSGRRFLGVRGGADAEGRGSRWSLLQQSTLTPERSGAWRPQKNTLTRLYKDGDWALGSEVCHPHRDADRRSLVCTYPVSESDHPTSLGRLRRKR